MQMKIMKPRVMKHKQIFGLDFSEFELFNIKISFMKSIIYQT